MRDEIPELLGYRTQQTGRTDNEASSNDKVGLQSEEALEDHEILYHAACGGLGKLSEESHT